MTWRGHQSGSDTGGENQHQAQIERDALRVVGLAQARFNAGIIAGPGVSEARIPALRERANGLLLARAVAGCLHSTHWCVGRGLQTLMICAFYT